MPITPPQQHKLNDYQMNYWSRLRRFYLQLAEVEERVKALELPEGEAPSWYLELLELKLELKRKADRWGAPTDI